MRPPEETRRRIVAGWLHEADADLDLAEHLLAEGSGFLNAIAFHSQQAAEKYLKAMLTSRQIEFPKTHELARLLKLIATVEAKLADALDDVIVLTPYGVALRYPGDRPDTTQDEAREAVELARKVRHAVTEHLKNIP